MLAWHSADYVAITLRDSRRTSRQYTEKPHSADLQEQLNKVLWHTYTGVALSSQLQWASVLFAVMHEQLTPASQAALVRRLAHSHR
jgi:hypothetical protein